MASRLKLQDELEELLGSTNVYFQPPASLKMQYDCIRYELDGGVTRHADNKPYTFQRSYSLTHIYRDPDDSLIDQIAMRFPMSRFNRHYSADGLNHDTYTIYY